MRASSGRLPRFLMVKRVCYLTLICMKVRVLMEIWLHREMMILHVILFLHLKQVINLFGAYVLIYKYYFLFLSIYQCERQFNYLALVVNENKIRLRYFMIDNFGNKGIKLNIIKGISKIVSYNLDVY